MRKNDGTSSLNFADFKETVERIRDNCDIILNLTSSEGLNLKEEERIRPAVELKPEPASYDAGPVNFGPEVFINTPLFLEKPAVSLRQVGVKAEIEVFETEMINKTMAIAAKGLIEAPYHFQFVLGVPGGMPAIPKNLVFLVDSLPAGSA